MSRSKEPRAGKGALRGANGRAPVWAITEPTAELEGGVIVPYSKIKNGCRKARRFPGRRRPGRLQRGR
jgi:hypothetical protein